MDWRIEATVKGRIVTWLPIPNTKSAALSQGRIRSKDHNVVHVIGCEEDRSGEHADRFHATIVNGSIVTSEDIPA